MRLRSTIDYLGLWEQINNPDFKGVEFDTFRNQAGTYAHSDIAFEFASWISPEFKLYIIKDYQRLKKEDAKRHAIGWDSKRELSKINYRIHTDAIKEFLMTPELSPQEINYKYASEADLLNMALFGKTAKQWRDETGIARENIRDYASIEQLIILINLESMNADLIREGLAQNERLKKLRSVAYYQMQSLTQNKSIQKIKDNILEEKQE